MYVKIETSMYVKIEPWNFNVIIKNKKGLRSKRQHIRLTKQNF